MSEPKALYQLCEEWRALARDFNVTRGDSQVEGGYYDCAAELEAALRAWDAHLKSIQGAEVFWVELEALVREQILGIKP